MAKISKLPAIPVITHDPFFSLWCMGKHPAADHTRHWAGFAKPLWGGCIIDGVVTRFIGRGGRHSMKCVDTDITPLSTKFVFEDLGVRLTVKFTSPLLLKDLDVMSTPITFIDFELKAVDGLYVGCRHISDLKNATEEMMQVKWFFEKTDGRVVQSVFFAKG